MTDAEIIWFRAPTLFEGVEEKIKEADPEAEFGKESIFMPDGSIPLEFIDCEESPRIIVLGTRDTAESVKLACTKINNAQQAFPETPIVLVSDVSEQIVEGLEKAPNAVFPRTAPKEEIAHKVEELIVA